MKKNRKSKYLGQAVQGNAEQATGEALGDNQVVNAGNSNHMKGNPKQVAEGVEDAFEE